MQELTMLKTYQSKRKKNSKNIIFFIHFSRLFNPKKQFAKKNTFYLSDKNIYDWDKNAINTYDEESTPESQLRKQKKDPLPPKYLYESEDKKYGGVKSYREQKKSGVGYHLGSDIFHLDPNSKPEVKAKKAIRHYANEGHLVSNQPLPQVKVSLPQHLATSSENPLNFNK